MFSPITQRSWRVRFLYLTIYVILILGGATMVLPFMLMVTGSVEPISDAGNNVWPGYLVKRKEMWNRYVSVKYRGVPDVARSSWTNPEMDLRDVAFPAPEPEALRQWDEFLAETDPPARLFMLGFLRNSARMPSYTGRQFRIWLMARYHTVENLNTQLGTKFKSETAIHPPGFSQVGPARPETPFLKIFEEFCATEGRSFLVPWNVSGYYRAVYLPLVYSHDIKNFNAKYGTTYASFEEVPFGSLAPEVAREDWFGFVGRILSPDFVELTAEGEAARAALGITQDVFVRARAKPGDMRVVSLDTLYAEWAAKKGVTNAIIPQAANDWRDFEQNVNVWKWRFVTMNYLRVLDEILLHGRAITNTLILVVLCVSGALLVNPLAAYALSRFKLRRTYHILLFCLATIAFPAEVTMIPVFLQLKEFHLLNTFGALVLPGLASGFSIFLLKGFFDSLPKELYEAAELDGASEWTMFWHIGMNLSKPILAVIALGAFTTAYGTFFYALILAPDPKMWTIMVYIYQLRAMVETPVIYASLIITAIPTLLVFIFCQNIILRGIVVPSDK